MKQYLLFDLDGTLTDPKLGITGCVQYALRDFGIEEPDLDKLEPFIGPPLKNSFMEFYGFDEEQAEKAIAKYRERFSEIGLFENEVYPGIPQMLQKLRKRGVSLAIASSKPTVFVERILKHFDLLKYFDVVVGSELDGTRVDKEEVVLEALNILFSYKPIRYKKVLMIGDRKFDVEGAKEIGVESVGVTYGYGSREELEEAQADHIVESVAELEELLLSETGKPEQVQDGIQPESEAAQDNSQPEGGTAQTENSRSSIPENVTTQYDAQRNEARSGEESGKPRGFFQTLWPFANPFIVFVVLKNLLINVALMGLEEFEPAMSDALKDKIFIFKSTGGLSSLTGDASAVVNIVVCLVAGLFISKKIWRAVTKSALELKKTKLQSEGAKTWVQAIVGIVCIALGLNVFMELLGITNKLEAYQAVVDGSYTTNLLLGILNMGIVVPLLEELIFRGIGFNVLRKTYKITQAALFSAVLFGIYHYNGSESVYYIILGYLLAVSYIYFGKIWLPIVLRIVISTLGYLITYTPVAQSGVYSVASCLILMAIGIFAIKPLAAKVKLLYAEPK